MNESLSQSTTAGTSAGKSSMNSEAANNSAKAEAAANSAANKDAKAIADAIEQLKAASNAVYQAFGAVGTASGDLAKLKVVEGRTKAQEMGTKAETAISEKPLMYVGIAFAAGWLLSRLSK